MKILIVDNYDSFTYNLYHIIKQYAENVNVERHDNIDADKAGAYDKIIFSPGPGLPDEFPVMKEIIHYHKHDIPILGICLGHQAIIEYTGGKLTNLKHPLHGLTVPVILTKHKDTLFTNIPNEFNTGRYHSWACHISNLPEALIPLAVDSYNMVMAFRHKTYNLTGMQYHPESIMTPEGKTMLQNWIAIETF
ncbi:MAG: aminodeoxychorismate/anthranilate synthase component II [Bacteroidales bacterium]